jgi:cobalt-zinc-cadmium efflux system protein
VSEHEHRVGHNHAHAPKSFNRAFAVGIALNAVFVLLEAAYGFIGNSTALLADAGHNLSDVLGLLIAWTAATLSKREPTVRFTYGLRGSSILAALFNSMFLLAATGAIAWEAIQRFGRTEPVAGGTVMIVAGIGILINGLTAWMFLSGRKSDINIRGAFLHMAADAAVSVGVVIAGGAILMTGWHWIDPAVSLAVCAFIFWSTWGLLKESLRMSLGAVPGTLNPEEVRDFLARMPGVHELHDLHIWPMSTTETALTCHLVMPNGHPGDAFLMEAAHELQHRFAIHHATMQIEISSDTDCALASNETV